MNIRISIAASVFLIMAGSAALAVDSPAKVCDDSWTAAKASNKTGGLTQSQFVAKCLADQKKTPPVATTPATPLKPTGTTPTVVPKTVTPTTAPAKVPPVAPAPTTTTVPKAGTPQPVPAATPTTTNPKVTTPQPATPTPGSAATPITTPAPAQPTTSPTVATPAPNPPAAVPAAPSTSGATTFTTEQLAKAHCPADLVVWDNADSHVYHYAGTRFYGTTKNGSYRCEADAKAGGSRAALNERRPQ